MFDLIARLRQRPLAVRRRVAFMTALSITFTIAVMWIVWLSMGGLAAQTRADVPSAGTPAESIWLPLRRAITDFSSSLFH
jgi:hypothetical protein